MVIRFGRVVEYLRNNLLFTEMKTTNISEASDISLVELAKVVHKTVAPNGIQW